MPSMCSWVISGWLTSSSAMAGTTAAPPVAAAPAKEFLRTASTAAPHSSLLDCSIQGILKGWRVIESETHLRIYRHLVLNARTCSASAPPVHITHVEGTVEFYYYSRGSVEGTRWLPESAPTHQLNRKLSESNSRGKIGTEAA